ncbi:MAG: zinc-dependent metalloprotease, partial [Planctomycetota bacterium]
RAVLEKVSGLMSLLEGHGDVTMDRAGAGRIPSAERFGRVLRQRRLQANPLAKLVQKLIGLEAKMNQYQQGEAFIAAVEASGRPGLLDTAWERAENAHGASVRLAAVVVVLALMLLLLVRPRALRRRLDALFADCPVLVPLLGGAALGFSLTLRPFLNPLVQAVLPSANIRGVFALVGVAAVVGFVRSPGGRARPRGERLLLLALASLLLLGPRVADALAGGDWLGVVGRRDLAMLLLGALFVPGIVLAAGRRRLRRPDAAGLVLALLALLLAYAVRLDADPSALVSRGANLVALVALGLTFVRGTPDGRLLVRLLASVALARRLTSLDGEFVVFVLLAIGAALAARIPGPRRRLSLAWMALGLLAIRLAVHHALGGTESFSTVDVAAGFVGLGGGEVQAVGGGDVGGVTPQILEATAQLALRFSLPWVVLLAAASRTLGRAADVRTLVGDLALTFAGRGAAITVALWAWWRSAWWVAQARAVYALGTADLLLLLLAAFLVGAWWGRGQRSPFPASAVAASR